MAPGTLTLKQRLAALSLAPPSPTSPLSPELPTATPLSSGGKRKIPFNPPWVRRQNDGHMDDDIAAQQRVQDVMGKLIFQAGVDFETRPMIVMCASALPDPRQVSYDLLLTRTLQYLNLYVESDYTVVFFAAGGKHTPGWNWVWKAYKCLSRKYRKHLKRLFIVHSNFFTKMLFSLAGAIISPKFFQKIAYISTLTELAHQVPLTQIDIPPAVYQENLKLEKEITLPTPSRSNVFGVPLEDIMGYDGEKGGIPRVVRDCIQFIRDNGLDEDGLFRRSPSSAMLRQAKEAYDRGQVVSLNSFNDPHLAAVLLKKYLRDLPEPIFPESLYQIIRRCSPPSPNTTDLSSVSYIRDTILPEIAPCAIILLNSVIHLLHDVSLHAATNRMDAHNLALVLAPNLVKSSNPARDVMMCTIPGGPSLFPSTATTNSSSSIEGKTTLGTVVKICIQRYYEIFDEMRDRTEAVTPRPSYSGGDILTSSESSEMFLIGDFSQRDEDDSIDDAMLVMPIGPGNGNAGGLNQLQGGTQQSSPSAWAPSSAGFNPRHQKNKLSNASLSGARSVYASNIRNSHDTGSNNGYDGYTYATRNKAKSLISIEKGGTSGPGRKGSIAIGRGTTKKSSGAGVEALGVTAAGFFAAPSDAPAVPAIPKRNKQPGEIDVG